jgi:2,3,4,5-tetrahydropyridine-2,6-dicarboxylate N-succinyltransferase
MTAPLAHAAWKPPSKPPGTPATRSPPPPPGEARDAIETTLMRWTGPPARGRTPGDGQWHVNQWAKKAVLAGLSPEGHGSPCRRAPQDGGWWDKVDSKFKGWGDNQWRAAGFRAVPGCVVRRSAYIAQRGVVLMPSFVNLGAYVGEGTMVDTWATVGSCAQIGKNVHLSGGVGIGGVLEPMQAGPTIIEDNCFIGARSEVVEGCIVREGSVLGMGVFIGQSTKIVDRATGEVMYGEVPAGSVVVAGSMPSTERRASVLRGDREAGGCADPVQDLDQRVAARLDGAVRED